MNRELFSPEGLKQNRETEGLCSPFLNGVKKGEQGTRDYSLRRLTDVPVLWGHVSCSVVYYFLKYNFLKFNYRTASVLAKERAFYLEVMGISHKERHVTVKQK